jgi:hypothetical protein
LYSPIAVTVALFDPDEVRAVQAVEIFRDLLILFRKESR